MKSEEEQGSRSMLTESYSTSLEGEKSLLQSMVFCRLPRATFQPAKPTYPQALWITGLLGPWTRDWIRVSANC